MTLRFWKLSGTGNDFVAFVSSREGPAPLKRDELPRLARVLCDRRFGVGGDGLLIVEREVSSAIGERPVVRVNYLNSDGSRTFCGNGTRCALFLAGSLGWAGVGEEAEMITDAGRLSGRLEANGGVSIEMPDPSPVERIYLEGGGVDGECCRVDTGVPHAVLPVADVETVELPRTGAAVRFHPDLGNEGANADFISPGPDSRGAGASIVARFYERGVESETLASGTGSVASAIAAMYLWNLEPPVEVRCPGGVLKVDCSGERQRGGAVFTGIRLEGDVTICFTGELDLDTLFERETKGR